MFFEQGVPCKIQIEAAQKQVFVDISVGEGKESACEDVLRFKFIMAENNTILEVLKVVGGN
jgi:NifU-like protein involved in Fe-S cluster formation